MSRCQVCFGRLFGVREFNAAFLVLVQQSGVLLRDAEFIKDGAHAQCHLCSIGCGNPFGFSGAGGDCRLDAGLAVAGDDGTGRLESDA